MNINFKTTNSAFYEYGMNYQLKRIFEKIIEQVDCGKTSGVIMDINGNRIGEYDLED